MINTTKAALVHFTGCSIFGDTTERLSGDYTIKATASTQLDNKGRTCGEATGTMTVTNNSIGGSVLSSNGFTLQIDGTASDNGKVVGGFAQGSNTIATFSGSFSGTSGSGAWEDNFDCVGAWSAEKSQNL